MLTICVYPYLCQPNFSVDNSAIFSKADRTLQGKYDDHPTHIAGCCILKLQENLSGASCASEHIP